MTYNMDLKVALTPNHHFTVGDVGTYNIRSHLCFR